MPVYNSEALCSADRVRKVESPTRSIGTKLLLLALKWRRTRKYNSQLTISEEDGT